MVGLCASELTADRLNLVSADCKEQEIDKIQLIIGIQAKEINEYLCYQCQIYLNLCIARNVFLYIFMAFDNF